jgi:hypothetical protein
LRCLGKTAQIDDGNQCPQQLGGDIGHDSFASHCDSGCAETLTSWVVQVVIPTCGFRPLIRDYKTSNTPMAFYIPFIPLRKSRTLMRISAYSGGEGDLRGGTMASALARTLLHETC